MSDFAPPPETDAEKIARLEFELERWESWGARLPQIFSFDPAADHQGLKAKLNQVGVPITPTNIAAAWALCRVHPVGAWNEEKARLEACFKAAAHGKESTQERK